VKVLLRELLEKIKLMEVKVNEEFETIKNDIKKLEAEIVLTKKELKKEIQNVHDRLNEDNKELNYELSIYNDKNLADQYSKELNKLRSNMAEVSFNTWIMSIKHIEVIEGVIHIAAPDEFHKSILESRYAEDIKAAFKVNDIAVNIYKRVG